MRTTCETHPRRRAGAIRTVVLFILLTSVASVGCKQEHAAHKGTPEAAGDLPAPASPSPERPLEPASDTGEATAPSRPKIRFERPDYDFGEAEAGEEVEHAFVFRNVGNDLLSIRKVLTSCGCTAALVSEEEVPPGSAGEIKVTFHAKGFQGAVKKGLTVESNDPENEFVRLTIGGNVVSEVAVEPRYLDWETLRPGDALRPKTLRIRFLEGRGLRLEKIQSESPSVVLTKTSEKENELVYSVALVGDLPTGRFTGRITVKTNSERVPEVHVPFHGQVQGNVKVIPHILSLGRAEAGKALKRDLRVSSTGKQGFTVQKVKATTEAIATEIHEEKEGARYRIGVTYTPGTEAKGRIAERITILVNDGKEDFLEVPVYGTIDTGVSKAGGQTDG